MTASGRRRSVSPLLQRVDTLQQGISQRPPYQRPPGQAERQVNGWSSVIAGVDKRRGDKLISFLADDNTVTPYLEWITISADERYLLTIFFRDDRWFLALWRDGVERVLIDHHGVGLSQGDTGFDYPDNIADDWLVGDSTSYLASPRQDLTAAYTAVTGGALALLINRELPTKMLPDVAPSPPIQAIVFIQGVAFDVTYTLSISGNAVSYTHLTLPTNREV